MKHKYKVIHFVNNEQVCEWKEEEIDPILYLNDFYNFIDEKQFDNAWGHGKGSKQEIYNVLKMHLKALEIIKEYPYELTTALAQPSYEMYCMWFKNFKSVRPKLSEQQYNLIRSVMCEDK